MMSISSAVKGDKFCVAYSSGKFAESIHERSQLHIRPSPSVCCP